MDAVATKKNNERTKTSPSKPCPPKLAMIMRDINTLPPSLSLLPLSEATAFVEYGSPESERLVKAEQALDTCLNHAIKQADAGSTLKEFIARSKSGPDDD